MLDGTCKTYPVNGHKTANKGKHHHGIKYDMHIAMSDQ